MMATLLLSSACMKTPPPVAPAEPPPVLAPGPAVSFDKDVKTILDTRCVVCHGCYDAPCQAVLSSYDGITRGATKKNVYDTSRLEAAQPTRLFLDATTAAGWRQLGFWPIVSNPASVADGTWSRSLMQRMLAHGRANKLPADAKLPTSVDLDIDRTLQCPAEDEFDAYAANNPWGGMPYAVAPLSDDEFLTLERWLSQGAPGPTLNPAVPAELESQVAAYETFFNGTSNKQRLTARYLYEHLVFAHFHFEAGPLGIYFQIVRSRTAPGTPIDVIATARPYDDPGDEAFYYRLRPVKGTIVHKTHIVYSLSTARLARWQELFLAPEWDVDPLPSYRQEVAANPFLTFAAIPARTRYQFMLDDAQYTIMTFIRGPVCRGEVAVDVIEDRFWVSFLDPDYDLSVTDPTYLPAAAGDLVLPAEDAGDYEPGDLWAKFWVKRKTYARFRAERYLASDPQKRGLPLAAIWDGDGSNSNALLTVMRHFDNAEVERGFLGAVPKTAWVIDYPIFERIYYDLVAGYNVFGGAAHQLSTRFYMDYLRIESEDLFLSFLPKATREPLRDSWYLGLRARMKLFLTDRSPGWERGTQVVFKSDDPKAELLLDLLNRGGGLWPVVDVINRCAAPPCDGRDATAAQREVERQLQTIASIRGPFVEHLPEISLLRVREAGSGAGLVYAIVHDRAHKNVAFLFGEEARLLPADDILTILPGYHGSYPNFFFDVPAKSVGEFAVQLRAVKDEASFDTFVVRWGVRRSSPRFWATSDWFQADFAGRQPVLAGLLDLNRYKDP